MSVHFRNYSIRIRCALRVGLRSKYGYYNAGLLLTVDKVSCKLLLFSTLFLQFKVCIKFNVKWKYITLYYIMWYSMWSARIWAGKVNTKTFSEMVKLYRGLKAKTIDAPTQFAYIFFLSLYHTIHPHTDVKRFRET